MAASRPERSCMTGLVFADTNVLVYRHDAAEPTKQPRADAWHTWLWRERIGRLRFQVLQELYPTLTGGRRMSVDRTEAQGIVLDYLEWTPVMVDFGVLRRPGRSNTAFGCPGGTADRRGRPNKRLPNPVDRGLAGWAAVRRSPRHRSLRVTASDAGGDTRRSLIGEARPTFGQASGPNRSPHQ